MTSEKRPVTEEDWETITGLPDDIDAWINKARFGFIDQYSQAITASGGSPKESPMMLFNLVNADGEEVANVGYSCGAGWILQGDGESIEHPMRKAIIKNSMYGQLMDRVTKVLKVPMVGRGSPLVAATWEGLGFHWKQESYTTFTGKESTNLMPMDFLGQRGAAPAAKAVAVKSPVAEGGVRGKLAVIASAMDAKSFQRAALKLAEVAENDELLSDVLDESEGGFWATHQES